MKSKILFLIVFSIIITACNRHQLREKKSDNGQLQEQYQVIETKDGSFVKDGYYKNNWPHIWMGKISKAPPIRIVSQISQNNR